MLIQQPHPTDDDVHRHNSTHSSIIESQRREGNGKLVLLVLESCCKVSKKAISSLSARGGLSMSCRRHGEGVKRG
eukprot:scaffold1618_cov196-Alexandrium_tamarense.AAC.4